MNLLKLLNSQINCCFVFFLILLGLNSCSQESKSNKYIAKINHEILTEEQLRTALSDEMNKGKYREEYIHSWIQTEVLFQEAQKKGITDDKQFNALLERSKKELAVALFLKKLIEENKIELTDEEINKYYEDHKDEFRLEDDVYLINIIEISNYDKAVEFRNRLLESDWKNAENRVKNDQVVLFKETIHFYYSYQLQPLALLRAVNNLGENEVSVIIETEPSKFCIVQMITKYNANSIPPLEVVKDEIIARLSATKEKDFLKDYIDKLITDHNPEIVRYSE
jgi:PPIC-type PPIASE domain